MSQRKWKWKDYFEVLLNDNTQPQQEDVDVKMQDRTKVEQPKKETVEEILKKLKNNERPGESRIPVKLLKK